MHSCISHGKVYVISGEQTTWQAESTDLKMDKSKFFLACFNWFKGLIDTQCQCSNLLRLAVGHSVMQEDSKRFSILSQITTDCYFGMLSFEIWIHLVYYDILELPKKKKIYSLTSVKWNRQKKLFPAKKIHKLHYIMSIDHLITRDA